ncbi:hypothetical protein A2555_02385 [Candidatus Falkowbacteria bacterium RIFOXYD2_FULL_39_16]|nr:MAG: hypothetical protein A2555_02385 [Candidatus Falkowbacteria bacterium RIFOXYD2_FULL_39_16]
MASRHFSASLRNPFGHFVYSEAVIRNSKNIFPIIRNFDRLFKKGNKFVFLFIRKGYKVFSPLRYENGL